MEKQLAISLENHRTLWDPHNEYADHHWFHQGDVFPDLFFSKGRDGKELRENVRVAIEVKSWYIFSKESEPSLRFKQAGCFVNDTCIVVIFPWFLTNVVGGRVAVLPPIVLSAIDIVKDRDAHWKKNEIRDHDYFEEKNGKAPKPFQSIENKRFTVVSSANTNFGRIFRLQEYKKLLNFYDVEIKGTSPSQFRKFLNDVEKKTSGHFVAVVRHDAAVQYPAFHTVYSKIIQSIISPVLKELGELDYPIIKHKHESINREVLRCFFQRASHSTEVVVENDLIRFQNQVYIVFAKSLRSSREEFLSSGFNYIVLLWELEHVFGGYIKIHKCVIGDAYYVLDKIESRKQLFGVDTAIWDTHYPLHN